MIDWNQRKVRAGVPKHSELEPHYLLVKGNGNAPSKRSLIAQTFAKSPLLCVIISPTVSWKWKACAKLLPELGVAVTIGVRDQVIHMSYSNPKTEFLVVISFALVFPVVGILPGLEQKARRQPNRPPSIHSITSSLTTIRICPFLPSAAVSDKPEVTLVVTANDPDGDSLQYEYLTTEGTISGEGRSVLWDLHGLKPGPHEVRVRVTDGKGGKVDGTLTVTTTDASGCDPPPPPCPEIKVSCPDDMHKSKPFIFSATIEEKAKDQTRPSFYWKINAGRIMKGQNSRKIEVSTTGANGFENITATVHVAGFDPSCSGTIVSCTTKIIW